MSLSSLRLDKLLWFLRLAKTRTLAQERIAAGHIRLNGRRVERAAQAVTVGDVLTLPLGSRIAVLEVVALPPRRGPAPEAQACYRVLDGPAQTAIAGKMAGPAADPLGDHHP